MNFKIDKKNKIITIETENKIITLKIDKNKKLNRIIKSQKINFENITIQIDLKKIDVKDKDEN